MSIFLYRRSKQNYYLNYFKSKDYNESKYTEHGHFTIKNINRTILVSGQLDKNLISIENVKTICSKTSLKLEVF